LVLEKWFLSNRFDDPSLKFATIYVNGSNSLASILRNGNNRPNPHNSRNIRIELIEERFMRLMFDATDL
jgi:hypothetical protein